MDGTRLPRLVGRGYEIAGRKIGLPHTILRATTPTGPLALVGTTPAAFHRAATFAFDGALGYGKAVAQAALDPAAVRVGDYLQGPVFPSSARAWFVAALDHLQPPLAVECNALVALHRPASPAPARGVAGYSGTTAAAESVLIAERPASLLAAGAGEATQPHLPGDAKLPAWTLLLPAVPGVAVEFADIARTADGRRFLVSGAELTRLGWRLSVRLAQV